MSLHKRKNSPNWWIKLAPIRGELSPLQISSGTSNKADAKRYHDKLAHERWEQDRLGVKPRRTFNEAAAKFLEETKHKRTQAWDISMLKWFTPLLGGKDLEDITRDMLDQVRVKRAIGVKPSTVNRYMALIRAILRRARDEWEWVERVPKVGMMRCNSARSRSLTREEFKRLLAELPPHLADMAIFSVFTLLRQSNVKNLKWSQVNIKTGTAFIPAEQFKNGQAFGFYLNEPAKAVLLRLEGVHPEYVFTFEGKPVTQVSTLAWRKALVRAGIFDFRWHDLRHTGATWHREAGTPSHELQRIGGWKDDSMVNRYANILPAALENASNRLNDFAKELF